MVHSLEVGHDLLPFVLILLKQPVDPALNLLFDLAENVRQNLGGILMIWAYFPAPIGR